VKKVRLPSGSTRSDIGEARFSLLWPSAMLAEARRMGLGANHHGENDFRRGQPYSVVIDHMLKHFFEWLGGDRREDHLAAARWGLGTLIEQEERIDRGELPASLDDLYFSPRKRKTRRGRRR